MPISMSAAQAGPPLVFLHGWGSGSGIWRGLAQQLPGEHLFIDLPVAPVELDAWLDELAARLPQRVVLIGWSLGGALATRFAARHEGQVAGLITMACNPRFVADASWPAAMPASTFTTFCAQFLQQPQATFARFCALQAQGDGRRKQVTQQLRAQPAPDANNVKAWQQGLNWLAQLDNRAALAQLQVPSLHIYGANDALVPLAVSASVAQLKLARVEQLEGCGHAVPLVQEKWLPALINRYRQSLCPAAIDKQAIAGSFGRAASRYDRAAQVQWTCARRLAQKVEDPGDAWIADLGCGTGFVSQALLQRGFSNLRTAQLDLAEAMVRTARSKLNTALPGALWTVADAESLPLADASMNLVLSNFALQWCADSARVLAETHRVLQPGGQLLFTSLGPRTLHQLRTAWAEQDDYVHVNRFKEEALWRSELSACGFEVLEFERDLHQVEYPQLLDLLRDLKQIGAHNMNAGRNTGLTPPARLRALVQYYERFRTSSGLLPASYDVYFVTARKRPC